MSKLDTKRLERLEKHLESKERKGTRLCWIRWDPNSKFGYEIEDAKEDIEWMVHEIRRLKEENVELSEFVASFRNALEDGLNKT